MMTSFQVVAAAGSCGGRRRRGEELWQRTASTYPCSFSRILAALYIARLMLDMFLVQRFCLAWRAWLTDRLTGDWLDGKAYYRARFIDDKIDNPDQRIQGDIDIFTAGNRTASQRSDYYSKNTLLFGAIDAVASMISFTAILWNLSGTLTLPIIGLRASKGDVLDRDRLRALRVRHRVLDRPADHLAVLQQREVQRGVPVRAGAIARRVGGGRLLPRRDCRTHRAAQTLRASRQQLQAVCEQVDRLQRLELVDESDHRAAAVSAAVSAVL